VERAFSYAPAWYSPFTSSSEIVSEAWGEVISFQDPYILFGDGFDNVRTEVPG
jgi:hypothetical protein